MPLEKVPIQRINAEFAASEANLDNRTVPMTFYTGAKVLQFNWKDGLHQLTLSMDPNHVRLGSLNSGRAPFTQGHADSNDPLATLGVIENARLDGGKGKADVRFSKRPDVEPIYQDVLDGILANVSVGASIYKLKETTKEGDQMKSFIATDWEPYAVALVGIGADRGAHFSAVESDVECEVEFCAAVEPEPTAPVEQTNGANAHEEIIMSENLKPVAEAPTPEPVNVEALKAEGKTEELARFNAIAGIVKSANLSAELTTQYFSEGKTVEQVKDAVIAELARKSAEQPATRPHAQFGRDETVTARESMELSLLNRFDPAKYPLNDAAKDYIGFTLSRVAEECLTMKGQRVRGMSVPQVVELALTTSDLPNILANVANKSLRQGYELSPRTFVPFCRRVTANDFKTISRVQISDVPTPSTVNEHGEFPYAAVSDSKESYALKTLGEIIHVTRQVIVNDDLQALTRVPQAMGMAFASAESDTVWGVITTNGNMADGTAIFVAGHSNYISGSGTTLQDSQLAVARKTMRLQKGPKGNLLNLTPSFLIVPAALEHTALQLVRPTNIASTDYSKVVPDWIRSLTPIVEPRLDATSAVAWYMAADPNTQPIDTIEYCYLQGQEGVYTETRMGFNVDGVEIKGRLDFAAAAVEHRGLFMSKGAA